MCGGGGSTLKNMKATPRTLKIETWWKGWWAKFKLSFLVDDAPNVAVTGPFDGMEKPRAEKDSLCRVANVFSR